MATQTSTLHDLPLTSNPWLQCIFQVLVLGSSCRLCPQDIAVSKLIKLSGPNSKGDGTLPFVQRCRDLNKNSGDFRNPAKKTWLI